MVIQPIITDHTKNTTRHDWPTLAGGACQR
jgi:hypothetical protein